MRKENSKHNENKMKMTCKQTNENFTQTLAKIVFSVA